MHKYDYLIVGAGLFGATFAHRAHLRGKRCLVIDKRAHAGGNLYCEDQDGIVVHKYGAHIFHTSQPEVWEYVNSLVPFRPFVNAPIANYQGRIFNLPFNMNTFNRLWGVVTPAEAEAVIARQRLECGVSEPRNLEEQALSLVGRDIYELLVKEYTEKQWGRPATELPAFIIRRLPVRFTYDNNYFDDPYQGIPQGGYNVLIDKMLEHADCRLGSDYFDDRDAWNGQADRVVFTGRIDEFFDYRYGRLDYRSLRFEQQRLDCSNYQGNAVVNYTSADVPYTRIIEHKHFAGGTQSHTVITREYPQEWHEGDEPYYPVNDQKNDTLYRRYEALAASCPDVIFGGRLAQYKYYDMDRIIAQVLKAEIQ